MGASKAPPAKQAMPLSLVRPVREGLRLWDTQFVMRSGKLARQRHMLAGGAGPNNVSGSSTTSASLARPLDATCSCRRLDLGRRQPSVGSGRQTVRSRRAGIHPTSVGLCGRLSERIPLGRETPSVCALTRPPLPAREHPSRDLVRTGGLGWSPHSHSGPRRAPSVRSNYC